jgi:hypothetical protein
MICITTANGPPAHITPSKNRYLTNPALRFSDQTDCEYSFLAKQLNKFFERIVVFVNDAFFERDDRIVGYSDVLRADLLCSTL